MQNTQAQEAGKRADDLIKNLANPSPAIETDKATVDVLDSAKEVPHPQETDPEQPAQPAPVENEWEKRFKNFKKSTDITIHELRTKVVEFDKLKSDYDRLLAENEELRKHKPEVPNEMLDLFSKEEVEGFDKLIDARTGALQNEVGRLKAELEEARKSKVEQVAVDNHRQVVDLVRQAVPNYEAIDKSPEFGAYMRDVDDYGNTRFDLLIKAKNETPPDIGRIVQFYVDFANKSVNDTQEDKKETKQFTQQELLQNPSSKPAGNAPPKQGSGIVWNQVTISEFYKDKATGKISPQRAAELEQDMYKSLGYRG